MAQEIYAISELINCGEYQKALYRFRDLETNNPKNNTIKFNKVGFLIDIGFGLKNSKIVKEGIVTGEKLLKDSSYKNQKTNLYYNCANGYVSFYHLEYDRERDAKQIVDNKNLQNAKRNFREAIKEANHFDSNFRSQLWTNYGNCLDSLGRGVEALYAYDEALKINPGFQMALGNKAMAMRFFADISGAYREAVYIKSYQMLISVLKNKDLVKFGGIAAKKNFEYETKQIEGRFKDKSLLSKNLEHPQYDISRATSFEKFYIEFCSKHKLFLNFHIHENECEASIVDPIFIRMVTPIDDNETFYNLAKHINQIKEDYAIARLLLVQSQFKRGDFDNISKKTTFVNTKDDSMFNIYVGLLKSAFKEAYNILDKISRFINEYYKLGVEGDIYFTRIWQDGNNKNERKIRPEIVNSKNISLYALYDIFWDFKSEYLFSIPVELEEDLNKDINTKRLQDVFKTEGISLAENITKEKKNKWVIKCEEEKNSYVILKEKRKLNIYKSGYYKRIQDIRNASVHERLVIYDSVLTSWDKKADKYNIGYETMLSQTIELLQLVKSSIIYLINFVHLEENKKENDSTGLIAPMSVDTTQFL